MGRSHFARLRQHPDAAVTAVCDRDARRRAGDWNDALGNLDLIRTDGGRAPLAGVRAYADPSELLADPQVDVVLITLPTHLHADTTVAALQSGKHVLCEKPMALRPGECDRMLAAAEASGRTLMIAQVIRFWPQYQAIRRVVEEGRLGAVRFMHLRRLGCPPTYSYENWLLDGARSGGAILDLHVHDIDFAHWLLGVPATITARGSRGPSGEIDHLVATWGYPDGRYAVLEGGWSGLAAPWTFEMEIAVQCERGTLGWAMSRGSDVSLYTTGPKSEAIPCSGDAIANEQSYFIDCVRNGRPVELCQPRSSRTSVVLAWLERRAIETGRPVDVGERLRAAWGP